MSTDLHLNESRSLVNNLSKFSEESKHEDSANFKKCVNDNWFEAVTPWKPIISHPRYYPHQTSFVIKRRSKPIDNRVPEWQRTNYSDGEPKQVVRCVNDELESGPYLHWKGMVEQVTYRYVPHNGYYRTMKFLSIEKKEWFTVNKKQPEQVSLSWQSKRYQKELKRQLKREFDNQPKKENERRPSDLDFQSEQTDFGLKHKEKSQIDRPRYRAKSTKVNSRSPELTHRRQRDDDGYLIPEIKSAPLPGDLYKSRSDLYIENISVRISALEQEIENDTRLRKPPEDTTRTLFRPKVKEKGKERDTTPRPYKKESLPDETFTAKSIGTKELRPSEKTNPISRISTADSKNNNQVTHLKYTTSSGNDGAHMNLPTIDLEKTLNSYKMAIETTRQSLLTTLSGKQITRRTIASKNYNSPTTITICDSGEGSEKSAIQEFIRPIKGEKRVPTKKDPLSGVGPLLPEIAGKRIEVPTTTHRWL